MAAGAITGGLLDKRPLLRCCCRQTRSARGASAGLVALTASSLERDSIPLRAEILVEKKVPGFWLVVAASAGLVGQSEEHFAGQRGASEADCRTRRCDNCQKKRRARYQPRCRRREHDSRDSHPTSSPSYRCTLVIVAVWCSPTSTRQRISALLTCAPLHSPPSAFLSSSPLLLSPLPLPPYNSSSFLLPRLPYTA